MGENDDWLDDEQEGDDEELCAGCGAAFDEEHDTECPYWNDEDEDGN